MSYLDLTPPLPTVVYDVLVDIHLWRISWSLVLFLFLRQVTDPLPFPHCVANHLTERLAMFDDLLFSLP